MIVIIVITIIIFSFINSFIIIYYFCYYHFYYNYYYLLLLLSLFLFLFLLVININIIVREFNLRDISWITVDVLRENPNHIFALFTLEHGLLQLVNEPARENPILDLLLYDCANTVSNVHNQPYFSTSDHSVIGLNIDCIHVPSFTKNLRLPD